MFHSLRCVFVVAHHTCSHMFTDESRIFLGSFLNRTNQQIISTIWYEWNVFFKVLFNVSSVQFMTSHGIFPISSCRDFWIRESVRGWSELLAAGHLRPTALCWHAGGGCHGAATWRIRCWWRKSAWSWLKVFYIWIYRGFFFIPFVHENLSRCIYIFIGILIEQRRTGFVVFSQSTN